MCRNAGSPLHMESNSVRKYVKTSTFIITSVTFENNQSKNTLEQLSSRLRVEVRLYQVQI